MVTQGQFEEIDKEYSDFVGKFRPKKTTDDCYTPENIYNCVRDWAVRRYRVVGEVVRPFWPGKDYTRFDYPAGCCVIDNPPFSIQSKIVAWYNRKRLPFFLFAPSLTAIAMCRDGATSFVAVNESIVFENGAKINVSFVTNMEGADVLCTVASDLRDALHEINIKNEKAGKRTVSNIRLPDSVITGASIGYLAVHHTPFTVMRKDAIFIRKLDNYGDIFGGGYLLSERAAAERAAAERAAAGRAAAGRAAAERAAAKEIILSPRENAMQGMIGK